jgi:xylulokinase
MEPALAARLGLARGVSVVAGGHDQTCAALGAGVIAERRAVVSSGTAEVLSLAFAKRPSGDVMFDSYYPCYLHAAPDMLFTFALNHSGGILFRWYRDNLGAPEVATATQAGADPYTQIVARMPKGPSPVMVLPHFNGSGTPTCDLHSKGAIVGMTFATTRHDIAKAILEALTFELRINCARLRETGLRHDELVVVGGGAKSADWLQLRADILGRAVRTLAVREAACLGAALLAGTAAGMYGSLEEGVGRTVKTQHVYEPHEPTRKLYDERFGLYQELYPSLKTLNHKM